MSQTFVISPTARSSRWPRWLPRPGIGDRYVHHAHEGQEWGACGVEVMGVEEEHPATQRPQCPACLRVLSGARPDGEACRAECSNEHRGKESFQLSRSGSGVRIEVPTVITRTEWTHKQATALRDALAALLDDRGAR